MPRSASSPTCCLEDFKIRKYVTDKYRFAGIPTIEIERTRDEVKVVLHAARPGVIIGRKGQQVDQLQDELQSLVGRRINIKIEEIARPEIQAHLVAEEIAEQLAQAGQLPPHAQAGDRADDGSRREGNQDSDLRPPRRCGNGPAGKADCRVDAAQHAAGEDRLRLRRSDDGTRQYWCSSVG